MDGCVVKRPDEGLTNGHFANSAAQIASTHFSKRFTKVPIALNWSSASQDRLFVAEKADTFPVSTVLLVSEKNVWIR